jgi:hypothetical protein
MSDNDDDRKLHAGRGYSAADGPGPAEDFVEEEWDEFDEDFEYAEDPLETPSAAPAPGKKKNSTFNNVVIGIAVVVGLIVVVIQAGGDGQKNTVQRVAQQQVIPGDKTSMDPASPSADADASTRDIIYGRATGTGTPEGQGGPAKNQQLVGVLNDPSLVRNIEAKTQQAEFGDLDYYDQNQKGGDQKADAPGAAQNAPPPADGGNKLLPEGAPTVPQLVTGTPPMPAPIGAPESAPPNAPAPQLPDQASVPDQNQNQDQLPGVPRAPDETAAALASSPAPASPNMGSDTGAADERLNKIADRLDTIEQKLDTLPADADQQAQIAKLTDIVLEMQKRLDSMSGQTVSASSSTDEEAAPKPAPKKKKAKKASSPHKASPHKSEVAAGPSWVLKAAQPGRALVAKPGTDETYSVAVGDTLAGVGQVVDIFNDNGRWTVKGTQGRILQ